MKGKRIIQCTDKVHWDVIFLDGTCHHYSTYIDAQCHEMSTLSTFFDKNTPSEV